MEGDGVVAGGAVSGDADDGGAPAVETQPIGDLVDDAFGFSDARAVAEDEVDAGAGAVVDGSEARACGTEKSGLEAAAMTWSSRRPWWLSRRRRAEERRSRAGAMPEAARHERAAETRSLVGREDEWEVEVERQAARETAVEQRVERKARRGAGTGAEIMKVQEGGAVKREESRWGSRWEGGVEVGGNSCNRGAPDSGSRSSLNFPAFPCPRSRLLRLPSDPSAS